MIKNAVLADTIASENTRSFNCPECDKYHFDCTTDCRDSAIDALNAKDAQPISELGGWHTNQPTFDCFVLLMTPEFPKNCPFVIAEWDNDAKVFYSESFDYPIPVWDCWKLIARNNILENPKYKDKLGKMALNGQIITNDEKATETE